MENEIKTKDAFIAKLEYQKGELKNTIYEQDEKIE